MKNNLIDYLLNFIENDNFKNKINNILEPFLNKLVNKVNPFIYLIFFLLMSNFITNLGIIIILLIKKK